jgi:lysozyme family protein
MNFHGSNKVVTQCGLKTATPAGRFWRQAAQSKEKRSEIEARIESRGTPQNRPFPQLNLHKARVRRNRGRLRPNGVMGSLGGLAMGSRHLVRKSSTEEMRI